MPPALGRLAARRSADPARAERGDGPRQPFSGRARETDRLRLSRRSKACPRPERRASSMSAIRCARRCWRRRRRPIPASTTGKLRLLVTGGSQGARDHVRCRSRRRSACSARSRARAAGRSSQQARGEDLARVRDAYATLCTSNARSRPSSPICPGAWRTAHLVIGRSGASTVVGTGGDRPPVDSRALPACARRRPGGQRRASRRDRRGGGDAPDRFHAGMAGRAARRRRSTIQRT